MTHYDPNTGRENPGYPGQGQQPQYQEPQAQQQPQQPNDVAAQREQQRRDQQERERQQRERQEQSRDKREDKQEAATSHEAYDMAKRTGRTYDNYDDWKRKETEAIGKRKKPDAPKELTKEQRRDSLLSGYAFGLEHNQPRTAAELHELKAVLGVEDKEDKLTDEDKHRLSEGSNIKQNNPPPRVENVQYELEPGKTIPFSQHVTDIPLSVVTTHPQWKGHQFYQVGKDSEEKTVIVDRDRKIVAVT